MRINIGDTVAVIDDAIEGVVLEVSETQVTFSDEHGFEMTFNLSEVVKISEPQHHIPSNEKAIDEVLKEKSLDQPKPSKQSPLKKKQSALEVDLHIHKLVSSEKGLSAYDKLNIQLDAVRGQLEFAMKKRIQKVVFIHGVGEGVLRAEIETVLRRYDNLRFEDADFKTYGIGATEVYIFQNP